MRWLYHIRKTSQSEPPPNSRKLNSASVSNYLVVANSITFGNWSSVPIRNLYACHILGGSMYRIAADPLAVRVQICALKVLALLWCIRKPKNICERNMVYNKQVIAQRSSKSVNKYLFMSFQQRYSTHFRGETRYDNNYDLLWVFKHVLYKCSRSAIRYVKTHTT